MSEKSSAASWRRVLERMFTELRTGEPRAEAYWAQQIAFGPVFVHAIGLALRERAITAEDLALLRPIWRFSLAMLGPLPDGCAGDPASLMILARRQAQVLAWRRRRHLERLAVKIGLEEPADISRPVPRRFQRAYPLIDRP